jgi:hypothetical protein
VSFTKTPHFTARLRRLEIAGDAMAKRFVWDLPVHVDWRKAKEEA